MKVNKLCQVPEGFRDRFFESAKRKKKIESGIENIFVRHGYSPVIPPTIEYSSVFLQGLQEEDFNKIFQFFDYQGNLLALRADPTCSLARLVCTKLNNHPLPLRLYYITNVFRKGEPYAGKLNEFTQAGVEVIGENSIEADFEVLSLATEVMTSFSSQNYQITLSHSSYLEGILSEVSLDPESAQILHKLLKNREKVELEKFLEKLSLPVDKKRALLELPGMIGKEEILKRAYSLTTHQLSRQAISYLRQLTEMFQNHNIKLIFDLGEVKKFDYYSGIIFKIYAQGSSFPIGGGGRYDQLLKRFGRDLPAVGFSLTVERLEEIT